MQSFTDAALKSWKTTVLGWIAAVAILLGAINAQFDSDPETKADWTVVMAALAGAAGLTAARDNDKTSESTGAK